MKKILAIVMVALLMLAMIAACNGDDNGNGGNGGNGNGGNGGDTPSGGVAKDDIKIGVVHIGPLADQGYTFNHDLGARTMISNLGLRENQYIPKFDVGVDPANVTAAINELVQEGCHIIFATSFSHGFQMIEVAREQPDIVFAHATGDLAHSGDAPPNLHNYFAKIHQARYLAGIAAGLRTETNVLGYVAAHPFAEVISGFTAFYLGALSVNPDVTMEVIYINSWGDPPLEQQVATRLIELGADVIAQHSDSATPALAAQEHGAWHVGYNNDMREAAPDASMLSPRIDWSIYMTFAVKSVIDGTKIPPDWGEGLSSGAAFITGLNDAIVAPGTDAAIEAARNDIINNNMMIFKGHLKDKDGNNAKITDFDGNVIFEFTDDNSFFAESSTKSAPSFNAIIAGINIIS